MKESAMLRNRSPKNTKTSSAVAKVMRLGRNRLADIRAENARREFNVWAWEQNRQGRQARLG
jgi:hypothetical protein